MTKTPTETGHGLRQRAEKTLRAREATPQKALSVEATEQLLHELRVHQIELEMQNDELHRAQHELEQSRARYFDLYDLAPVGYLTLSEQGLIQEINLAAATMLGVARGELVKQPISRIICKEDQDIYYLYRRQLLETGEAKECELRLVKMDGTVFWTRLEASAEQDTSTKSGQDTGGALVLHVILSDITERKRAQEELLETNRELEAATALAHEMAAKSEAANLVKSQFLANISHELRTPMTGVLGMLDLVRLGNLDAEQREFIEISQRSALALVRILNDILDLTRIEAGKLSIEEKPFSVRDCVASTRDILFPAVKGKGIDFNCTVADDVPDILVGDQHRISQVLTNLAGNAVKFTPKGKVELRVTDGGITLGKRKISFTVRDSGIGIPGDKINLLFHAFSQADDSHSRSYGGAGLGLVISQEIVELMGGTITFTSEEGVGSTFTFTLPLAEAPRENEAQSATKPQSAESSPIPAGERMPRILLAEDDPTVSMVLGQLLGLSHYGIDFAEDGQKAIEMWEQGGYDLVLLDIQMPRLNGFEVASAIRGKEQERGGHIPIVAMTAHAGKEAEEKCLAAGMDTYIAKPINFDKTLQVIAEALKNVSAVSG